MTSKTLPAHITSYDLFKALAVLLMIVDHIGMYFVTDEPLLRALGRICVPIWMFLVGYARTRAIPNELWIGAGALVVSNFVVGIPILALNILVTVIFIRLTLDKIMNFINSNERWALYLVLAAMFLLVIPTYPFLEYGTLAYLMAMFGYSVRQEQDGRIVDIGRSKVIMGVSIAAFILYQQLYFGFVEHSLALLCIGIWGVHVIMERFEAREYTNLLSSWPSFCVWFVQLLGRQTLMIYVVHLLMFKAVALYIGLEGFELFDLNVFSPGITPFVEFEATNVSGEELVAPILE